MAQLKVGSSEAAIRIAAEQFLGKGATAIRDVGGQILEGFLRAYLGSSQVEEIYQNRDQFNSRLLKDAAEEFRKMGLELVSFALIDISDSQGYLLALGKPKIAAAKRDAEVAEAETDRDAAIKTAEARKVGDIAKLKAETEIAMADRDFEMSRADFAAEVNQKKAAADSAYELERQKIAQKLKGEEVQIQIVERKKLIELEDLEIKRREKELVATVEKTSEARKKQVEVESEAEAYRLEAEAKGKSAAARLGAEAEAEALRLRGAAEAEAMREKAASYREYNEAAVYQMLVERLPDLARAVSEPLSKLDKITIVDTGGEGKGVSKITGQVADVLAQIPEVVESLGGVDIRELARRMVEKSREEKPKATRKRGAAKPKTEEK
jgi:flotillin